MKSKFVNTPYIAMPVIFNILNLILNQFCLVFRVLCGSFLHILPAEFLRQQYPENVSL